MFIVRRTLACHFGILEPPLLVPLDRLSFLPPFEALTLGFPLGSGWTHLIRGSPATEYLSEMLELHHVRTNPPWLSLLLSTTHTFRFHLNS